MKFSMMFILSLVLTLSMTDGFILRAENGGETFKQRSPDSVDLLTLLTKKWTNKCPNCPGDAICLTTSICPVE
uniref:Conopeptide n=1 Tax=Conus lenavati TaxID=1519839 RepID=A0A0K8TUB5_CONLV